ncbi:hypothetical protein LIER_30193 [Lithospermum erythrorhizon]|uniref:Uncharacterized protein n=1 Tax=Lithospermum erythrorhizon TaxID=34254 RepID=A0AAV3RMU1_LITER
MITPLESSAIPIASFDKKGKSIYVFRDEDGHQYFDVCECQYCKMHDSDDEDKVTNPHKRKNKKENRKKSMQQQLKEIYEAGDPEVDLLGEPSSKEFEYFVLYSKSKISDPIMPEINMFQYVSSDFPSSNFEKDDVKHSWKVKNPLNKLLKEIASNQEKFYQQTQQKVSIIEEAILEIQQKMALLHQECLHQASSGPMASPLISQKEADLKFLKAHLFSLQNPPPMPTSMPYDPFSPFPDYSSDESLSPIMMVGVFPQEDEIESEADNSAHEQTTQAHVELPPEAPPYFVGNSQ